jgi:FOG: WD40-like repeat
MEKSKNKLFAIVVVLVLVISIGSSAISYTVSAHDPSWTITPVAYCYATPSPCGVGQTGLIVGWLNYVISGASTTNNIRFENYKFIITAPDGTEETYDFDTVEDTTSSQALSYTPKQAGTYNITFLFPGQTFDFGGAYNGDYYTPANATYSWIVQEEAATELPQNPLPSEYWSRPINQNQNTYTALTLGSNWLGGVAQSSGLMSLPQSYIQYNGAVPLTSHVMWTKSIEFGGALGSTVSEPTLDADTTSAYYSGMAYNIRFQNPIIINGVLYYQEPSGYSGYGGGEVAVDLLTGEEIWRNDDIYPTFATLTDYESVNGYGAGGAILWQVSGTTWIGYNAYDDDWAFNITNVPSGTQVRFNDGTLGIYQFSYNTTTKTGWLALWNMSKLFGSTSSIDVWAAPGRTLNGSSSVAYSWNETVTADLTGDKTPTIIGIVPGEAILGASSSLATTSQPNPNNDPWTIWALSDDADSRGDLLWKKQYEAPDNNQTQMFCTQPIDSTTMTFAMTIAETGQRLGYSLTTGELLWGPVGEIVGFQYYSSREGVTYNGNLYVSGYGGVVYCYDMTDGDLIWTYGNGGEGNSTSMGENGPWGNYPTHIAAFGNGVVYTFTGEHSPSNPLYSGALTRALNATTGEEIWTLLDWSACGLGNSIQSFPMADGYGVMYNCYDSQLYTVGKGPSQLTVTAPDVATTVGTSLMIKGTVMDISAGTQQTEQATKFSNGVPAVSEESMSDFMAALYEDQEMPDNVTGVPVTIYVIDANGNYRSIGTTTTDSNGFYSLSWVPDISGKYTVYAVFSGTNSYYGSQATTAFVVDEPAATTAPQVTQSPSAADMYFIPAVAGLFIAVVAVGLLTILVLKKKP